MKRRTGCIYRMFFLLIACITASAVSGCLGTIGSIDGYGADDLFWTVPNRVAYDLNDLFLRNSDLRVFTSYQGVIESIPLEKVEIGIAKDPDLPDKLSQIPVNENLKLDKKGRNIVVVKYDGMSASYSIEVRDPYNMGGGNGNGGDGGSGIEIDWETPVTVD